MSESVSSSAASSVCGSDLAAAVSGSRGYRNLAINHVVGHFDVNRTFVPQTCLNATDNLRSGALLIEQHRTRHRDFIVDAALRFESFNLVMKKRIFFAIFAAGRAAHNHNGRLLGVCARNRVHNIESAYAVGHANQTDAINARISVGGETRGGLVCHRNAPDFRFLEPGKCRQNEVAWKTETVANTAPIEIFKKKLA